MSPPPHVLPHRAFFWERRKGFCAQRRHRAASTAQHLDPYVVQADAEERSGGH